MYKVKDIETPDLHRCHDRLTPGFSTAICHQTCVLVCAGSHVIWDHWASNGISKTDISKSVGRDGTGPATAPSSDFPPQTHMVYSTLFSLATHVSPSGPNSGISASRAIIMA